MNKSAGLNLTNNLKALMLLSNSNSPKRSIVILQKKASTESSPVTPPTYYNRPFSPPRMLPSLGTPPLVPNKHNRTNSQTPKKTTDELTLPQKNLFTSTDQYKSMTSPNVKKLAPIQNDFKSQSSINNLIAPTQETLS